MEFQQVKIKHLQDGQLDAMQGLYELKNHQGWSVSRDDELQVMYRHQPGLYMHCHVSSNPL